MRRAEAYTRGVRASVALARAAAAAAIARVPGAGDALALERVVRVEAGRGVPALPQARARVTVGLERRVALVRARAVGRHGLGVAVAVAGGGAGAGARAIIPVTVL